MIATQPVALVANKEFPANTLGGSCCAGEEARSRLNYTSPGPARRRASRRRNAASSSAGIRMTHINYNGSAPALTDVIAGRVPLMFDIWHSARRYVESGELKLIAGAGPDLLPGARERADDRRNLSGLRRGRVQRRDRAGGDAGAGPGEAFRRHPRGRRPRRSLRSSTKHLGINR